MTAEKAPTVRLRELNKQRTREAIVHVAIGLFVEQGFRSTTLVEIADAVGVAPSTLHTYFPLKDDLLFSIYDAVLDSASTELLAHPEPGIEVISRWVENVLPAVLTRYGADLLVRSEEIIRADPELCRQRRFRDALLEDILASAFQSDLEADETLRAQVAATIALHAIKEVWDAWYEHHAADSTLTDLTSLTANHVKTLLGASRRALKALPAPAPATISLEARARGAEVRGTREIVKPFARR